MTQKQLSADNTEMGVFRALIGTWLPPMLWGVTVAMLIFAALVIRINPKSIHLEEKVSAVELVEAAETVNLEGQLTLPEIQIEPVSQAVLRQSNPRTILSSQPRLAPVDYVVDTLDSIFGIASKFKLKPESILWANYEVLNDNPDMLEVGLTLKIPPVDGVLYTWQENDTIEAVAKEYKANAEDIILFSGNYLDMTDPVIEPGATVMIPGGKREFRQWVMPTIPRGPAGVSTGIQGTCNTGDGGAYGTGTFIYPTRETRLSGNDYWDGHLAIDLAVGVGDPIAASDSGVVVYAGWNATGYGYMVMIDHGNGYQTLYAHLSNISVSCGQSVNQGNVIGYGGSTGNSTGPHLHFEVRYMGGFVNPWWVLP